MPKTRTILAALALAALAGGCGTNQATAEKAVGGAAGKHVTVSSRTIAGLGTVLVTADGHTLYMFPPDHRSKVTCTGVCAGTWPPLRLPAGATPVAQHDAKPALLGSVAAPGGGRVITYHGWPLYTYAGDPAPGQANGQALNLNGGFWYVLRPDGQPLTPTGSPPPGSR